MKDLNYFRNNYKPEEFKEWLIDQDYAQDVVDMMYLMYKNGFTIRHKDMKELLLVLLNVFGFEECNIKY